MTTRDVKLYTEASYYRVTREDGLCYRVPRTLVDFWRAQAPEAAEHEVFELIEYTIANHHQHPEQ